MLFTYAHLYVLPDEVKVKKTSLRRGISSRKRSSRLASIKRLSLMAMGYEVSENNQVGDTLVTVWWH